jgi:hypothetical protein
MQIYVFYARCDLLFGPKTEGQTVLNSNSIRIMDPSFTIMISYSILHILGWVMQF